MKCVTLPGGEAVPSMGQGTWKMGERAERRSYEIAALRAGVELGMTLIDTAEMYGDGAAETLICEALGSLRDQLFLVSKAYPQNASRSRLAGACEASLKRLGTDRLDLYLLHWRGSVPLAETVEALEALKSAGKIRYWGVSNLDTDDMDELVAAGGDTDSAIRQGYARRFIEKVVVAPGFITITGPVKALTLAANNDPDQLTPAVPSLDREWCPTGDKAGHSDHWKVSVRRP